MCIASQIIRSLFAVAVIVFTVVAVANHPDILMIAVDDLRPMLGCYGDARIQTPNIDYAACISYVDAQIGKLLKTLRESDRFSNSIVILWSDHGWHLGEQSAWGKMTNFEIATRVPLIVSAPGFQPARTETIAELVDLYPTICELANVETPGHLEGESLLPALRNPHAKTDAVVLSQYSRFRDRYMGRALRSDRYRFVAWIETDSNRIVHRELYDHKVDPNETTNLAGNDSNTQSVIKLEAALREAFRIPAD